MSLEASLLYHRAGCCGDVSSCGAPLYEVTIAHFECRIFSVQGALGGNALKGGSRSNAALIQHPYGRRLWFGGVCGGSEEVVCGKLW